MLWYTAWVQDNDFTKILGWPGYRVFQHEINAGAKTLRLWVRRMRRSRALICSVSTLISNRGNLDSVDDTERSP